jgi:hypothetical protein
MFAICEQVKENRRERNAASNQLSRIAGCSIITLSSTEQSLVLMVASALR